MDEAKALFNQNCVRLIKNVVVGLVAGIVSIRAFMKAGYDTCLGNMLEEAMKNGSK